MYVFLLLLIGFLLWNIKEPFTIHIEGDLPKMPTLIPDFETIHAYTIKPVYQSLINIIPYKHHYRKLRRHLFTKK